MAKLANLYTTQGLTASNADAAVPTWYVSMYRMYDTIRTSTVTTFLYLNTPLEIIWMIRVTRGFQKQLEVKNYFHFLVALKTPVFE